MTPEALSNDSVLLDRVLHQQVIQHPLPWRVESDWTEEVIASDGYCIAKCMDSEEAQAVIARASSRPRSVIDVRHPLRPTSPEEIEVLLRAAGDQLPQQGTEEGNA